VGNGGGLRCGMSARSGIPGIRHACRHTMNRRQAPARRRPTAWSDAGAAAGDAFRWRGPGRLPRL